MTTAGMVFLCIACAVVGFFIGWYLHLILAAREFEMMLWQSEKEKQELINQFNGKIEELEEMLDEQACGNNGNC